MSEQKATHVAVPLEKAVGMVARWNLDQPITTMDRAQWIHDIQTSPKIAMPEAPPKSSAQKARSKRRVAAKKKKAAAKKKGAAKKG